MLMLNSTVCLTGMDKYAIIVLKGCDDMEIRVLKYFLAAAREQSISGAAESLFLSQPTLSRQLSDLEKELGKKLFIRGSRKITLTEEGMLLRQRAEEIIDLVDKTESEIASSDDDISGDIYLGAGETDAIRLVVRTVKHIRDEYPKIVFHNISGDAIDVIESLNKGLIDFGILFEPVDLSKYEHIKLPVFDNWGVLMRRDSELAGNKHITSDMLAGRPLIISRQLTDMAEWLGLPKEKINIAATYNLVFNASLMVDEGIGYALTLDKLINVTGESSLCFIPMFPPKEAHMHLVWKKYQVFSKAAERFLENVRAEINGE